MENIQKILENAALVHGISLIISVVVPVMIMIITLLSEKKRHKEEIEVSKRQFKETSQKNDKYHKESMQLQEKNNRISQLPFLSLNQDIKIGNCEGKYRFALEIINIGNGTALGVRLKYKKNEDEDKGNGYPSVYKEQMWKHVKIYRYVGFLFTNVIRINSKATFELELDMYENDVEVSQEDEWLSGEVRFTVEYTDMYYNEYEQDYMFQYSLPMGIGRVESNLPRLVEQTNGSINPNLD